MNGSFLLPDDDTRLQMRLSTLEQLVLRSDGLHDYPERATAWAELASLYTRLDYPDDARISWVNALWEADLPPPPWMAFWFHAAAKGTPAQVSRQDVSAWMDKPEGLDRLLAYLFWTAGQQRRGALEGQQASVRAYLDREEARLPIRGVWLARVCLARLFPDAAADLPAVRSRLLERLLHSGVQIGRDLPDFLHAAERPSAWTRREMGRWMLNLCKPVQDWSLDANAAQPTEGAGPTLAYVQLMFAYGLARLGELDASCELIGQATKILGSGDAVHALLLEAFTYRIELAREGRKNAGPLPERLVKYLDPDRPRGPGEKLRCYIVNRMRQHSWILEPTEKVDPYLEWGAKVDELAARLAEVIRMTQRQEIIEVVRRLLLQAPRGARGHEWRTRVLHTALQVAPRVNEDFVLEMLNELGPTWDALPDVRDAAELAERAELLERGLFAAAHFDLKGHVAELVTRVQTLLQAQRGNARALKAIEQIAGATLRDLRSLGMRDEMRLLLPQIEEAVRQGKNLDTLREEFGRDWPAALRVLLLVASGWLSFGKETEARAIFAAAGELLLLNSLSPREQTQLAKVYAQTIGGMDVPFVKEQVKKLFDGVTTVRDTLTTSKYYSLWQLQVVEAVVLSVAGEDSRWLSLLQRWRERDALTVRRRIAYDRESFTARAAAR